MEFRLNKIKTIRRIQLEFETYLNEEKILTPIGKGKRNILHFLTQKKNILHFSNARDRVLIGRCDNGLGSR